MIDKRMITFNSLDGPALVRLDLISAITPRQLDNERTSITVVGGRTFTSTETVEWWKSQYKVYPLPQIG